MEIYLADLQRRRIDVERAKKQKSIVGDPFIAPANSNYPEGSIVDYFCLVCGSVMCAHDEDSGCWRAIVPQEKLEIYDLCQSICSKIEDGLDFEVELARF